MEEWKMKRYIGRYAPYLYAILRIISGLLFVTHGTQKLFGFPGDKPGVPIASLFGFAGLIEVVGGLLIAIGLLTSIAAFIASGEMAVAYFMAHFPQSFWPVLNGGEPAVLFCFIFLYIAAVGAGVWSIDRSGPVNRTSA
jgi:putative oxidoreductase